MAGKYGKGFTLVELLIVVSILGIFGALAYPQFEGYVQQAKEAAAKDNLRVLRNAIGLYAAQHDGINPGYPNNIVSLGASVYNLDLQLLYCTDYYGRVADRRSADYPYGPYLPNIPKNPFAENDADLITVLNYGEDFPANADGNSGWYYHASTGTVKLNWPGTDSKGISYYNY